MRSYRVCLLSCALLWMDLPTIAQSCPKVDLQSVKYGLTVDAHALASVGKNKGQQQKVLKCIATVSSDHNKMQSTSSDEHGEMTTDFEYTLKNGVLSTSSHITGALNNYKLGIGLGNSNLRVTWQDTLYFKSAQIPSLSNIKQTQQSGSNSPEQIKKAQILLKFKLLANPPPSCAGITSGDKTYFVTDITLIGTNELMGDANLSLGPPQAKGDSGVTDMAGNSMNINACALGATQQKNVMVLNGGGMAVNLTAQVYMHGALNPKLSPSLHLKVDIPSAGFCLEKPAQPSDLKITSASGIDYVCK